MAEDQYKAQLIAELDRARSRLSINAGALRHDLDFSARAKSAFKRMPLPWLGGAAFLGLLVAKLPRRAKKVVIVAKGKGEAVENVGKLGLALGALKIALDFARPVLTAWAKKRVVEYASGTRHGDRRWGKTS